MADQTHARTLLNFEQRFFGDPGNVLEIFDFPLSRLRPALNQMMALDSGIDVRRFQTGEPIRIGTGVAVRQLS